MRSTLKAFTNVLPIVQGDTYLGNQAVIEPARIISQENTHCLPLDKVIWRAPLGLDLFLGLNFFRRLPHVDRVNKSPTLSSARLFAATTDLLSCLGMRRDDGRWW